ncbi:hypothetical protein CBS147323_8493 [Aspergillus niger]|nr:hypothetical protein CBS147323_8493 [Aspergillus niger]KAI3021698.1 hypothetical protein CBS147347_7750 [Aspergillus niger]KAI3081837.1 hypothetical protein CBS147353_2757 [Aspergillus niger]
MRLRISHRTLAQFRPICFAATTVIIHEDIAEKFATGLKVRFEMFKNTMGDPLAKATFLGPLADKVQTERIRAFFEQVKENPPLEESVLKEEIFGPALGIKAFRSEGEAIRLASDTNYGLSACVYTNDIARALRVSGRLESGTLDISYSYFPAITVPFAGWTRSGNGGREGGYAAAKSYLESKTFTVNMDVGSG